MDTTRETTLEDPAINTDALREKYYWQRDHLRLYGLDYVQRLKEAGFRVSALDYVSLLPAELRLRYALRTDDKLFIATK